MSVKFAECGITKIRADLDLAPSGNMTDSIFRQKSGQLTGSVKLSEYKGNVMGQSLELDKTTFTNPSAWKKKRWECAAFYYLYNQGGATSIGGSLNNRWICQVKPVDSSDIGTEIRQVARVSENGNFRLTGKCYGRFSSKYPKGVQIHINIIANATDYLAGEQDLLWNWTMDGTNGDKEFTLNEVVPLTTSKSYVTVIARAIGKAGSGEDRSYSHEFWDLILKRVS